MVCWTSAQAGRRGGSRWWARCGDSRPARRTHATALSCCPAAPSALQELGAWAYQRCNCPLNIPGVGQYSPSRCCPAASAALTGCVSIRCSERVTRTRPIGLIHKPSVMNAHQWYVYKHAHCDGRAARTHQLAVARRRPPASRQLICEPSARCPVPLLPASLTPSLPVP
jgi:hypothetical protein